MEITLEKKDKVNASLKIQLSEADYKPKYNNKLKEISKKAQIKGFRPGHVPTSVIEKMYGKSILIEEVSGIISENINSYIKENSLEILGDPIPSQNEFSSIDWDKQKDFNFTYNLGLVPEFKIDFDANHGLVRYNITINDSVVKETIENLRKQYGNYTDSEVVTDQDIIYADAKEISNGKDYKCILPEFRIVESQRKLFTGAKVGDTIQADIRTILGDDASVAYVLGVDKKEASFISGDFTFTITRISHSTPADLNEEFYTKIFRGADIKTYEDFEQKVKENIIKNYEMEALNALYYDVFKYIVAATTIELPVEFLKSWLLMIDKGKISKEEIESQFGDFEKGLKWDLIKNKIAKENGIKVENEEILKRAQGYVLSQFGIADTNLDGEMGKMIEQITDNMLKKDNGKEYKRFFDELYTNKVLDTIISKMTFTEKSIDIEEFRKLREK
jgi:trigger factor